MRNVVLMMSTSVDGYVAGPHGHAGAVPEPAELSQWKLDRIRRAGTHIMGRVTYEEMAGFWPTSTDDYAAPMNEIPKVVFSNSLTAADWADTTIAAGDLATAVKRLKQARPEGYLLAHGGVRFARSLIETGLIDEYRLVVHPVVLGAGEPLFTAPLALAPVDTIAFSGGVVAHVFTALP